MSADERKNREDAVPLQDLENEQISADDAASVKGGFNPQPDPPGVSSIITTFNPGTLSGIKQQGL